jgi:hypothetical protein
MGIVGAQLQLEGFPSKRHSRLYATYRTKEGTMAINRGGGPNRGGASATADGISYDFRTIGVNTIEEKTGKKGKFWKAEDEKGRWYFVWSSTVLDILDSCNDSGESVFVRIEIKPDPNNEKRKFYTITHAGQEAKDEQLIQDKSAPVGGDYRGGNGQGSSGPVVVGVGVDKEIEILKAAVSLAVAEAEVSKPKETQAFLEAQVLAYRAYLTGLLATEAKAPAPEDPGELEDDDIPF